MTAKIFCILFTWCFRLYSRYVL